jgi:hypothetical protein
MVRTMYSSVRRWWGSGGARAGAGGLVLACLAACDQVVEVRPAQAVESPGDRIVVEGEGISLALAPQPTDTRGMSGREIMLLNEKSRRARKSEIGTVKMTLRDAEGRERHRRVRFVIDDRDELNRKTHVEFIEPAEINGVQALSLARGGVEDQRFISLPLLGRAFRISEGGQTASFLGSDFTFEDFSVMDGRIAGADRSYRVLGELEHEGKRCWLLETEPTTEALRRSSGYGKRLLWVEQQYFVAVQEILFNRRGQPFKRLTRSDLHETQGVERAIRPHRVTMFAFETGHQTELLFEELELNRDFDVGLFDVRRQINGER